MKHPADHTAGSPAASTPSTSLLILLIAMSGIGPLSLNILVPAIPGLSVALAADPSIVQLAVSLYFAGLACAQLVLGTLSDRFGRRPVLIAGFLITLVTSLAAAAAPNITALVVARTAQALGASTGIVIGRAIVRDLYTRDRAASMLGWVTMSVMVIPMFGPVIGGLLDTWWSWRAIFIALALVSLVTLVWMVVALPETRPATQAAPSARRVWKESRALLRSPAFFGFAFCGAMASGPFYTLMGGAPHVVVTLMGRSSTELGLWFALSAFGYMFGNFLAGRFSVRYGGNAMLWSGLMVGLVGSLLAVVLIPLLPNAGPAVLFLPVVIIYVGNGMALPNAIAGAISVRPEAAGTASGLAGFLQMGFGAVVSQLITYPLAGASSAMPVALTMTAECVVGLLLFWFLLRNARVS